ncbi:MAG: CRTAC1 family protein [Granulosicoccus sp.]
MMYRFNRRASFCRALAISACVAATAQIKADDSNKHFMGDVPLYVEQSGQAGIDHSYAGGWEYFVGGGVSSFDCNGDRMPELFFAGGQNPAALYINRGQPGGELVFDKDMHTELTLTGVLGSYPIDIDNDGFLDLFLMRVGANKLYKGAENCSFKPANASWGFDGGNAWTTAFSATFESDNAYPTLAIGNYVDRTAPGSPWGTCHDNELYRPQAAGTHQDLSDMAPQYDDKQILSPGYCALSMLFTDWNKSGNDALRITNDRHYYRDGQEQLWRLDSGSYPRVYGPADGWEPLVIWGMGIAETDLNADGFPEYALTSMGDTKLQVLDLQQAVDENRPAYEDMAWDYQVTAHRPYIGDDIKPSTGWHAQFEDVNNDGRLDLFIAKGNVENMQDFARFDPDNLLMGNTTAVFSEQGEAAGLASNTRGRGANVIDLNADGLQDIVVVNRAENISLFRHAGMQFGDSTRMGGNWLKLELQQAGANRNAIGARLSIKTGNHVQSRRIQVGGGHASGMAGFVHVGLGVAERATVRVQWPDGQWSAPYKLFANRHVVIKRDQDHALQWFPPSFADTPQKTLTE